MMTDSSKYPSFLWLWWRRKSFYVRRQPYKWFVLVILGILFCITRIANPFSSQYTKIPINQNVQWDSISEMLETKEKVNIHFIL